jgi:RHS repeat-associated protein
MDKKLTFTYDYMGRRVEKKVYRYDTGASDWEADPNSWTRWVYYDWLPILVLDGLDSDAILRKFTWGLDLAGQSGSQSITAAGGIGGLLATRDEADAKSYVHFYDANGNTGQLILRADGSTAAHYEYDAYGNVTAQTGSYAADNTWRFSTKQWDDETGQGYWGERYYEPDEGRWASHDPIREHGGLNFFVAFMNQPTALVDALGLRGDAPQGRNLPPNNSPKGFRWDGEHWVWREAEGHTRHEGHWDSPTRRMYVNGQIEEKRLGPNSRTALSRRQLRGLAHRGVTFGILGLILGLGGDQAIGATEEFAKGGTACGEFYRAGLKNDCRKQESLIDDCYDQLVDAGLHYAALYFLDTAGSAAVRACDKRCKPPEGSEEEAAE